MTLDCPNCNGKLRFNDFGFCNTYFKCENCGANISSTQLEQERKEKQIANKSKYRKFLVWLRTGRVLQ